MTASHASVFDLSARAKFRLTGSDRVRFLNGQTTNDVRKARESVAVEACVLSVKGRIQGHVFISAGLDCFFLDTERELRAALLARLERYVIADDVQIEDVTDQFSIFHILGTAPPDVGNECRIISALRFVNAGWDIWIDSANSDATLQQLLQIAPLVDAAAAETLRIEQGIPKWGNELTDEIIPIEANLESRTIDYEKGCYIGQEVISRMKMSGQTNKQLRGILSLNGIPLETGMKLVSPAAPEKEVGWITSATRSGDSEIALGYAKRGSNEIGTKLEAVTAQGVGTNRVPVKIISLPLG
jgi:folate-binding protein YgfZ